MKIKQVINIEDKKLKEQPPSGGEMITAEQQIHRKSLISQQARTATCIYIYKSIIISRISSSLLLATH